MAAFAALLNGRPLDYVMRFLPSNRSEWLGLLSLPFQAYIVVALFFLFHWFNQLQTAPREVGRIMYYDGIAIFIDGYIISFFALTVISIVQALSGRRRAASWNAALAVTALVVGFMLIPRAL